MHSDQPSPAVQQRIAEFSKALAASLKQIRDEQDARADAGNKTEEEQMDIEDVQSSEDEG
jgi:hypothetical protein